MGLKTRTLELWAAELPLCGVVGGRLPHELVLKKRPGGAVVVLATGADEGGHPAPFFAIRSGGQGIVLHPLLHHRAVGQALRVLPAELAVAHCAIG
jgi:hypothetical protein